MRYHFNLGQRIHIITNLAADGFANMLHIVKSLDNTIIIYAKEKRAPPKPLAKALMLFNQLFGFFSSSINLKSYAVHSAIRLFNSIWQLILYSDYKGTIFNRE